MSVRGSRPKHVVVVAPLVTPAYVLAGYTPKAVVPSADIPLKKQVSIYGKYAAFDNKKHDVPLLTAKRRLTAFNTHPYPSTAVALLSQTGSSIFCVEFLKKKIMGRTSSRINTIVW